MSNPVLMAHLLEQERGRRALLAERNAELEARLRRETRLRKVAERQLERIGMTTREPTDAS